MSPACCGGCGLGESGDGQVFLLQGMWISSAVHLQATPCKLKGKKQPAIVVPVCSPSTWEAEAGQS
jgi:hypothetical protein